MPSSLRTYLLARLSVVVLSALSALVGCTPGPVKCDEPDHSCGQPPPPPSLTIAALRQQARGSYSPDAGVPLQNVVVTAVNSCVGCTGGHVGDVWIQEIAPDSATNCPRLPDANGQPCTTCGRACAIQVFQATLSPTGYRPSMGDLVNLSAGQYQEFQCATCGHPPSPFPDPYFVPEVAKPTVSSSGITPLPPPIPVTLADLENNILQYMGVLVILRDVTAAAAPDARRAEFTVMGSTSTNGLHIAQELVNLPGVTAGTHWDSITGIATYFYTPKLLPRSLSDVVNQH